MTAQDKGDDKHDKHDKHVKENKDNKDAATGPGEDVKRRFREALEKKHAHGGRDVSGDGKGNRIHGAHSAEGGPQMFRRKSG
jgi:hypothetical protein